jgi:tetratricopeptide (TPR) repeat protein
MKKVFLLAVLLGVNGFVFASTASTSWLLTNVYPEAAAEGSSGGVSTYGVQYAGINPAAIAGVENFSFEAMQAIYPADISVEKITAGKYFDFGIIGVDLGYYNFGQIFNLGVDSSLSPVVTGEVSSPYAFLGSLIYAKKNDYFSLGFSLKMACEDLAGNMTAYALADAGIIADDVFTDGLTFGAGIINISADNGGFSAPLDAGTGLSYSIRGKTAEILKIYLSGDYMPAFDELKGSAGFDFPVTQDFIIRGGITAPWNGPVKFSAGLSIKAMGLSFNYAYLPDSLLGDVHKVSIGAAFGRPVEKHAVLPAEKTADIFGGYLKSGDFYYDSNDFRQAIKYYEYVNLLYWKELESLTDVGKSNFYQKLGICYYNMKDNGRALQYFERAFYYDKDNEILKHWIRLLKNEKN